MTPLLINLIQRLSVTPRFSEEINLKKYYFIFLGGALLVMSLLFSAYYPGGFSPDSINQYKQAISGEYSDWHPVLHTLVFFTLPLKLTGGWVGSIFLFQALCFSFILAYLCTVVLQYSNKLFAFVTYIFILLNPFTLQIIMYPWKDVGLALCAMLAITFVLQIYFTQGEWLKKYSHIIFLGIVLSIGTVFRHNAVLFTVPLLLAILLFNKKWRNIVLIFTFLATYLLVKLPLYSALGVQAPGKRATETLGLPMTIIGNVVVNAPDELDDETKEFVYAIASQEDWETYYTCGNFNSLKFNSEHCNTAPIDEAGFGKVLRITLKCCKTSPLAALLAAVDLTEQVYGIRSKAFSFVGGCGISANDHNIQYAGFSPLASVQNTFNTILGQSLFRYIFYSIGFLSLAVLAFSATKINLRYKEDRKLFYLCIPMLIYNFGTMLLLTGSDIRFFYFTVPVTPCLLLLLLRKKQNQNNA